MKYRRLGRTDLVVSTVGFGTWQFGGEWGRTFALEDVARLLAHAKERGINFVDTAECYGDGLSESLIGRALRGQRADWILATKFGHKYNGLFDRTPRWSARQMVEQLDRSLDNLETDHVDLYQLHSPKDDFFADEELWAALLEQVKAGKVRHLGISISSNDNLAQTQAATRLGADALQIVYNRLDRTPERRVFPSCMEQGLGVLARVPLASGFLSGRFKPNQTHVFSPDEVRGRWYGSEDVKRMVAEVAAIAETELPPGVDMATWSLAFCLRHPAVTSVIPGMTSVSQIDSNTRAADLADQLQ
jgi:aryl-alcohol dehydrogenase-like predicted oxidoreductase